ncbi:unnamed protein product, partial [marine sediment metagenome]
HEAKIVYETYKRLRENERLKKKLKELGAKID